ncbi:MAG: HEAT repeat domain-containing protein [Flavobacteriaceae bacterium]|nr:HEAT repeat domain-containing protein [Flavobacteriaceae bacterium]
MNLKEHIQQHKKAFDSEPLSIKSDDVFKARLQRELHPPKKGKVVYMRLISVAASIVLVFSVLFWMQHSQMSEKTKEVLASLSADSAGERLEAVYRFDDEFTKEDAKIINALLKILLEDKNANVKIATIDALLKFPSNEKVRKSLIVSLEKEQTPLVQIKLIKAVSFLRENRAQKSLENIINSKQTIPIVKNNATLAMNQLKQ